MRGLITDLPNNFSPFKYLNNKPELTQNFSVGLGKVGSPDFMFYIKKFLHKPHRLAASLHCLCHELFSYTVAAVCVIALKAWPGQLDIHKDCK